MTVALVQMIPVPYRGSGYSWFSVPLRSEIASPFLNKLNESSPTFLRKSIASQADFEDQHQRAKFGVYPAFPTKKPTTYTSIQINLFNMPFPIIHSSPVATLVRRTVTQQSLTFQRGFHKVSLATLHQTMHPKTEFVPQFHGLRLHDHHAYKTSTTTPTSSVKELKTGCEPREPCIRQAEPAISREVDFRDVHGRARTLPNLDIGEVPSTSTPTSVEEKPAQVVASHARAVTCSLLPAEKETKQEHKVKIEVRNHVGVRRGLNPFLSRARPETEKTLCAADLDNIYNP